MKLIVAGATGFVGTEVIRQALSHPAVTSVVALARRATPVPANIGPDANISKLKSAICNDFDNYSESVKADLAGADACIWYYNPPKPHDLTYADSVNRLIAITPSKLRTMPFEQVEKICLDYTANGLKTMTGISNKPFRFIYTSGDKVNRDETVRPWIMPDYSVLRVSSIHYLRADVSVVDDTHRAELRIISSTSRNSPTVEMRKYVLHDRASSTRLVI
jgi:hypothetical protein